MEPRARRPRGSAEAALLREPRFEVVPLRGVLDRAEALPAGATVAVTASPSRGMSPTLELAERLAARGFRAVPHLAARRLRDRAELAEVLHRLDEAGIRDAFVVAGDGERVAGMFPDGLALLREMDRVGHRLTRIGVPGYPEGHPVIGTEALWSALRAKQRFAHYTVTQLCFDADLVCRFVSAARRRGVELPVVVGVPGVVHKRALLRLGLRIGVGESLRFALGHRGVSRTLLLRPVSYRPDRLVGQLAERAETGGCQLAGLHLYTFNRVEPTLRWLTAARRRNAA